MSRDLMQDWAEGMAAEWAGEEAMLRAAGEIAEADKKRSDIHGLCSHYRIDEPPTPLFPSYAEAAE